MVRPFNFDFRENAKSMIVTLTRKARLMYTPKKKQQNTFLNSKPKMKSSGEAQSQ
jgi:hypothetical protein